MKSTKSQKDTPKMTLTSEERESLQKFFWSEIFSTSTPSYDWMGQSCIQIKDIKRYIYIISNKFKKSHLILQIVLYEHRAIEFKIILFISKNYLRPSWFSLSKTFFFHRRTRYQIDNNGFEECLKSYSIRYFCGN